MQADSLARRVDGWFYVAFVPRHGRGEGREWVSDQVMQDVPNLRTDLRAKIFEQLRPHREQVVDEDRKAREADEKHLIDLHAQMKVMKEVIARLTSELDLYKSK